MKKLAAIAIAAIAAVAIVAYFGRSAETTLAPASEPEQARTPTRDVSTVVTDTGTQHASTASESSPPRAAPLTDEEQQRAACEALWERRRAREQAAIDAETKDPAWAYPMEQKLREYTTRRFQSSQIEVIGIDCKTTFCELRAQGFAPETPEEFNTVMDALRDEPWSDFTGFAYSHKEESGKTVHWARVTRREQSLAANPKRDVESEAVDACVALFTRRVDRERAARDAQPRDTSWADPMEQLLRQHITTQLAKHPVERLDITCRTTFCQVKASGRTMDSQMAFQKVSQEVASEPWAELRTGEAGGGSIGDEWHADVTLYRRE